CERYRDHRDLHLSSHSFPTRRSSDLQEMAELMHENDQAEQQDARLGHFRARSEEHTSELQSRAQISYAVICLKKKKGQGQLGEGLSALHWTRFMAAAPRLHPFTLRLGFVFVFFECYGDDRVLHLSSHSFPTRRSSD